MKVFKTSFKLKNNNSKILNNIVKDYLTNEVQENRKNKLFNFTLSEKYKQLKDELFSHFLFYIKKHFDVSLDKKYTLHDVCAYVSNNIDYDSWIHNHADQHTISAVYYLNVPLSSGGELEFYDDNNNKIGYIKPNTNDFILFDSTLNHKPLPSNSKEYRIALNLGIKF